MANHSFSFPVDSFGNMQQNMSQHLQPQQNVAGVPDAFAHAWSHVSEPFRISNGAAGGPQASQGAHQMSQQHQNMPQNMSLMGNQALTAQMQRQTPRMPHTVMNNQNQYQQQQQPQQHQLQFTQNNLIGNMGINHNTTAAAAAQLMGRQIPAIFPPSSTNPAVALQLQKINNGIASGQAQLQRSSGSSQGNVLQQSSANYAQFEHRMNTIQEQGKLAVQSGNTMQIRQARDAAAEVQKKSNEERERWMGVVQQVRANGIDDNTAKQVELWFARYQKLYERANHIFKSLETTVQSIQQQQQQAQHQQAQQAQHAQQVQHAQQAQQQQQQHQNPANMMSGNFANDGRVSALGMSAQQQWNGLQREAANQAAMHTQSPFAAQAQQNRSGLNAMNYSTNFPNSTAQQPAPDFNAMQNRPGMSQMANAQLEPNAAIKENFLKLLQMQHVEPRVFIAGHPIDLWELWHTVKRFDMTPGHHPGHPSRFQVVGAQLGLPTDSQGQMPLTYLKELQDHYARVSIALQSARPQARQVLLPQTNLSANQPSQNTTILQTALKANPHIDFGGIPQDWIANLPPQRFDTSIKQYISERQPVNKSQIAGNTPHLPPRTPVPGPATMNPRIPTPVGNGPTNNGQMSRQPNMAPPLNIDEIIRLHDQCQHRWRQTYETLPLPTFPLPNNIQVWKDRYKQAMQEMKPIIMAMGLYLHMRRDQKEMMEIIQKSVLLMKQMQLMGTHILLTIQGLEETINFFHPRMVELQERIERLRGLGNLPPALHALINPSDTDFVTIGGLLPAPPSAPTPSHPQTPAAGRMTPAPPVAGPTPPHLAGPPAGLARHRRNGISDAPGASMTPPATFGTSPAAGLPTAASPAPSPPKAGKVTRPRGNQKRKPSKSANTPTPAAETSTPTPATTAPTPAPTLKRPFDETEAQAPSQPGLQPSAKRVKTEPSPPAMPPKPVTSPPQISAPIKREEIHTAEDAKALLTDSFKKAEEQAVISQSQGQGSQDLDLGAWLSQIVAGSADPGPSTLLTDLGSLIPMANEPDSQVEGADIEFFDYTAYFDIEAMIVPELDQRPTLSPESHNDATTTPPSQTNVPARPGAKATEQKATGTGAPLATAVKVEDVQIGTMNASDYMMNFFGNAGFSYDGPVEQLDEPWAIA